MGMEGDYNWDQRHNKVFVRIDDGERFTPNGDGTWSLEMMKKDFPDSLCHKYKEHHLNNEYFRVE